MEIGFGIAPERRRRGHATRALAALIIRARADPAVRVITAQSATANFVSRRVLEKNHFVPAGISVHPEDGEVICWRHDAA